MNSSHCPACRAPIPADAPGGICPACALLGVAQPTGIVPQQGAPGMDEVAAAFPDMEILEVIGQGGMGVVYKARQPRLDRLVALKILPPHLAAQPGFAERFTREARALARLSHPHIVAVYDFGESGGFYYLVMEFVDGVNLRQAMRTGIKPEQAMLLVPHICRALQFAHDRGVLHRDIKPENILLDRSGTPKLADFGIAKFSSDLPGGLTLSGAALGTAAYMAPEQVEKPATVDHRADIYSLGVVFYEMLTGELPLGRFAAPSEKANVGESVDAVVMRALEKERERRQQSAGEMKTEVERVDQTGPRSRNPSVEPGSPYKYSRNLLRILLGGLTGAALVAVMQYHGVPPYISGGVLFVLIVSFTAWLGRWHENKLPPAAGRSPCPGRVKIKSKAGPRGRQLLRLAVWPVILLLLAAVFSFLSAWLPAWAGVFRGAALLACVAALVWGWLNFRSSWFVLISWIIAASAVITGTHLGSVRLGSWLDLRIRSPHARPSQKLMGTLIFTRAGGRTIGFKPVIKANGEQVTDLDVETFHFHVPGEHPGTIRFNVYAEPAPPAGQEMTEVTVLAIDDYDGSLIHEMPLSLPARILWSESGKSVFSSHDCLGLLATFPDMLTGREESEGILAKRWLVALHINLDGGPFGSAPASKQLKWPR